MDTGHLVLAALLIVPVPLVMVIGLLRGYSVTIHFRRHRNGDS